MKARLVIALFIAPLIFTNCKARTNKSRIAASNSNNGSTDNFLDDPSKGVEGSKDVLSRMEKLTKGKLLKAIQANDAGAINSSMAEWLSVRHQMDLVKCLDPSVPENAQRFQRMGLSKAQTDAMIAGVVDSDKGKLAEYRQLMTDASVKSDLLFDTLKLDVSEKSTAKRSASVLQKVLQETGKNGGLLNKNTTNDRLRQIMREVIKGAPGYLHDFPGIADAIQLHESGRLTDVQFAERLKANLFHNGPDAGFWKTLKSFIFTPQATEAARELLGGTLFDRSPNGSFDVATLDYPGSMSETGFLHRLADRISQGTRGGVLKIFYEIVGFKKPAQAMTELTGDVDTLKQVQTAEQELKGSKFTEPVKAELLALHEEGVRRLNVQNQGMKSIVKTGASVEVGGYVATDADRGLPYASNEMIVDLEAQAKTDAVSRDLLKVLTDSTKINHLAEAYDNAMRNPNTGFETAVGDPIDPIGMDQNRLKVNASDRAALMEYTQPPQMREILLDAVLQRELSIHPIQANAVPTVAEVQTLIKVSSPDLVETLKDLESKLEALEKRGIKAEEINSTAAERLPELRTSILEAQRTYESMSKQIETTRVRIRGGRIP